MWKYYVYMEHCMSRIKNYITKKIVLNTYFFIIILMVPIYKPFAN